MNLPGRRLAGESSGMNQQATSNDSIRRGASRPYKRTPIFYGVKTP